MRKIKIYDGFGNCYKVKVQEIPFAGQAINILGAGSELIVKGIVAYEEHTYGIDKDYTEVYLKDYEDKDFNRNATRQEIDYWDCITDSSEMIKMNVMDDCGKYGDFKIKGHEVPKFDSDIQVGICEDKRIRGEVSAIEHWIKPGKDDINVIIKDTGYNDEASFENVNWW